MARKKPTGEGVAAQLGTDPRGSDGVRRETFEWSRELVTVEPTEPFWAGTLPKRKYDGAIVRLRPPATAGDEDVAAARLFFEKRGAERVIVLPRPRAEVVPQESISATTSESARAAVLALARESNSTDRNALAAFVEEIMAEEGL